MSWGDKSWGDAAREYHGRAERRKAKTRSAKGNEPPEAEQERKPKQADILINVAKEGSAISYPGRRRIRRHRGQRSSRDLADKVAIVQAVATTALL
jgi:hypothetical protein